MSEKTTKEQKELEKTLNELHKQVAEKLLEKIESGDATAQEYNAAIKFLKDNHIEVGLGKGSPADDLANALSNCPIDDDEEYVPIRRVK